MKEAPHRSGEHGQPQRPRTQGCGNTGLPGGFPAPQGRRGLRLRSPAARGPGRGQIRRHRALGQPGGPAPGRERRRDLKAPGR